MYLYSAPFHSLLSFTSARGRRVIQPDRGDIYGSFANETRLGMQAAVAALVVLLVAFVASLLPLRGQAPAWYSIYNPQPLLTPGALSTPGPETPGGAQPGGVVPVPPPTGAAPGTPAPTAITTPLPTALLTPGVTSTVPVGASATPVPSPVAPAPTDATSPPTVAPTTAATSAPTPAAVPSPTPNPGVPP
jgi:hypothetical protein